MLFKFQTTIKKQEIFGNRLMIELRKQLKGAAVDDWIRLLNVKTEGELEMISAKNRIVRKLIEGTVFLIYNE